MRSEQFDRYTRQAMEMVTSGKARRAFELDKEDPRLRDAYGRDSLGEKALLARRLIEAGRHVRLGQRRVGLFRPSRRQRASGAGSKRA